MNFLWLKNLEILCNGHNVISDLNGEKLLERFMKKNCKNQIKKSLELEK